MGTIDWTPFGREKPGTSTPGAAVDSIEDRSGMTRFSRSSLGTVLTIASSASQAASTTASSRSAKAEMSCRIQSTRYSEKSSSVTSQKVWLRAGKEAREILGQRDEQPE
jgi:hypothetical protein